jgi:toxin ParE1/3/4
MPNRGRVGRIAGTRELVSAPLIIMYRIESEIVEILRIYHSAQDWP